MALIRELRQLNLSLPLPEPSERRPRFNLPLHPTAAVTTSVATDNCFSTAISATYLEKLQVLGHCKHLIGKLRQDINYCNLGFGDVPMNRGFERKDRKRRNSLFRWRRRVR
ncbi:hypothetical protein M0R45_001444 [Rubus argutus]|uniref:Uncharacterized protein n=1 Tax=Rubus argutus TaxID=59490 RepID=A0AAW1VKP9_RUBAR